jgi:peptide-methionine (S)-S-oxide reductase
MTTGRAVVAGGCFWSTQDLIRKQRVISTRVGYTGGKVQNATYRGHEGHTEAAEIIFDPARTSYWTPLEFFPDPRFDDAQSSRRDLRTSYCSAITTL